jgi:hypothetical protein
VVLRGRVVAAANDAALRRVRVAVAMGAARIEPVFTDDDGRFRVPLPLPGSATLTATKAGYAATTLPVPANVLDREVNLRLARGAAISGRIVDASGTPAADVSVAVRRVDGGAGGTQRSTTTDDLGEYRLGGLAAGRYLLLSGSLPSGVMISGASSSTTVIVQVSSPSAPMPRGLLESDQTIDVTAGQDVTAADLRLPAQPTAADQRAQMAAQGAGPATVCPGTASVRVRVTTDNGEPLAGVSVWLTLKGSSIVSRGNHRTGASGMTVFDCLTASDARIEVSKRGYALDRYGDRRTLRMEVSARDGQVTDAPAVVMRRTAAAVGTVTDEHGEPMEGVMVRVLAVRYANGRTSATAVGGGRQTDDRGRFRVYGLQPGAYLVAASVDAVPSGAGAASAYVPTYFPGTPDIGSATELHIAGEDVTGLDLTVTPSPAARVSGVALDSEGNPVRGRVQLLVSQRSGGVAREPIETPVGAAGEFVLSNVPPGDYVLHAIRPAGLGSRTEVGSTYVAVTRGNPAPVTIRTSEGSTMSGRLAIEDSERRSTSGLSLTAFPVDFDRTPLVSGGRGIVLSGDGTFYFTGLHGPTMVAMTVGPDGWYLKTVRIAGADVTDSAVDLSGADVDDVEIVISTAGASLTGRTADAARVDDYAVVVFPVDATLWSAHSRHMKLAPSAPDGSFRISGLPPGAYFAAALDPLDPQIDGGAWQDPGFLARLSSQASRVTLADGERRSVTLRVAGR